MAVIVKFPKDIKFRRRRFAIILAVLPNFIARGGGGGGGGGGRAGVFAAIGGGGRILRRVAGGVVASSSSSPGRMTTEPWKDGGAAYFHSSSSFAYAAPTSLSYPPRPSSSSARQRPSSPNEATSSSLCDEDGGGEFPISSSSTTPSWSYHPDDPGMWLYHVETTTSTMDEARRIVEGKFAIHRDHDDDGASSAATTVPTSFLVSATSQTNGRGTSNRNWAGSHGGNALFTIGVMQSSWTDGLRERNDGISVPLTLLPLKVGSLVAFHVRGALRDCVPIYDDVTSNNEMPGVTVKWPNDVLLRVNDDYDGSSSSSSSSSGPSHEKIAGILVETSRDWFLIGIGINVGYAPHVPTDGDNRGRKATCLSRYCRAYDGETGGVMRVVEKVEDEEEDVEEDDATTTERRRRVGERHWIEASRKLATDVAYDMHSWLHSNSPRRHSGESILEDWKSYVDWDMELTLRDTPNRERVTLEGVLEDGRAVVREVDTGRTRTLVSDYFL